MNEELASSREVVNLGPPQALDEAEYFLAGQGYDVIGRTATTLTVERERVGGSTGQGDAPRLVVVAVPQPGGGVRIKVRGNDREGVRERQAQWAEWIDGLPKRVQMPPMRVKVVSARSRGRLTSRLPTYAIFVAGALAVLVLVVVVLVGSLISSTSRPEDATEVVRALEDGGLPIGETKTFNAENDPNNALGRPGQYTSKTTFYDTRLEPSRFEKGFDVANGGTVEVFEEVEDAERRKEYVDAVSESFSDFPGMTSDYSYREGPILLRVSGRLTPTEAEEYEAAFREAL